MRTLFKNLKQKEANEKIKKGEQALKASQTADYIYNCIFNQDGTVLYLNDVYKKGTVGIYNITIHTRIDKTLVELGLEIQDYCNYKYNDIIYPSVGLSRMIEQLLQAKGLTQVELYYCDGYIILSGTITL